MKKFLHPRNLPFLTMGLTGLGLCTAFWFRQAGYDEKALPIRNHPIWILLLLLTALTAVLIYLGSRSLQKQGKYTDNFPASLPGVLGCVTTAVILLPSGVWTLMQPSGFFESACAVVGLLCVPLMFLAAWARLRGRRTSLFAYLGLCLYFTLHLLYNFRRWTSDPILQDHLFQALANVFLILWSYHRTAFEVNLGNRSSLVFCGLLAFFCCFVAVPTTDQKLFYCTMGLLPMTNLCSLTPAIRHTEAPDAPNNNDPA